MTRRRAVAAAAFLLAVPSSRLDAQHEMHRVGAASPFSLGAGASALFLATQVDPGIGRRRLREGYVSQPMVHGHARALGGMLSARVMLNFEGATLQRGELTPGIYGEGFVDRRHPHTWLHEAIATVSTPPAIPVVVSVSGGKGFAPFGSDDPMVRPIVRFPVNHHLSQVLERGVLVVAARWRPLVLEYGIFNGDEPEAPGDAPNASHFGDSWAGRVTVRPVAGFELQGSSAHVRSPESPSGHGFDHLKRSASLRIERSTWAGAGYLLAECAITDLYGQGRKAFHLSTTLVEGALQRGPLTVAARVERTLRPEEDRLANPFRTPFPTAEVQILGTTRFDVATVSLARAWNARGVALHPFAEATVARPRATTAVPAFVPEYFYGAPQIVALSVGIRLAAGMPMHRAGRYGAGTSP